MLDEDIRLDFRFSRVYSSTSIALINFSAYHQSYCNFAECRFNASSLLTGVSGQESGTAFCFNFRSRREAIVDYFAVHLQ